MKADQMISAVRDTGKVESNEQAERAIRATLTVLGRRIGTEASDLAAQLPPPFDECLSGDASVERFGMEEFYQRVAAEEGSDTTPEQARQHARAVMALLREAVGAEYLHVLDQLPDDYTDLVHTGPVH